MTDLQSLKDVDNSLISNVEIKILRSPSARSFEEEGGERGGVHNFVENKESIFLGFAFGCLQNADELFEGRVRKGGDLARQKNRTFRAKVRNTGEGAIDALANVWWEDLKVVVSKTVEGAEEAGSNGSRVPAGVGVGVRA